MNALYEKENLSMLNLIKILILVSIVSNSVIAKEPDADDNLNKINQLTKDSFGVSIHALMYLSEVSQTSYLRLEYLEESQKLKYIIELESNGYVKMHKVKGLPDGTQKNEVFINIIPLFKGFDLIYSLQNMNKLKNKSLEEKLIEFKKINITKSFAELQLELEQHLKTIAQHNNEQEELISKAEQQLKDIDKKESKLTKETEETLDSNNDGVQDIFYEINDSGYIYLFDRNFDGKKDESWKYDLKDRLISGASDNNFDGVFETKFIIENGMIIKELIDSDQNGNIDTVTFYKSGISVYSEKYYPVSEAKNLAKIGKVTYEFGEISEPEVFTNTTVTEIEFQNERLK